MVNVPAKLTEKANLHMDVITAIIFLCAGILAIAVGISLGHYVLHLPAIVSVASLFYLLFRKRLSQIATWPRFREVNRIRVISHIVFIITISSSIWLLWSTLYERPLLYFMLFLVAAASIIMDTFCLDEKKGSHISLVLFKIIVLSLSIYVGIYYQFPGIYGVDPWLHNRWIQETVTLSHITMTSGNYFVHPVFQLISASMQNITTLSTYSSVFAVTGVFMAISSVFVFLIGRKLINVKAALLAALIVPLTASSIERATAIIPMSLGFCFFLAILYLVFCRHKTASDISLIILLSASLILTHPIASLVTLLSLIAIFIGTKLYKRIDKPITVYKVVSLTFIVLFGVAMLGRWMQIPPGSTPVFNTTLIRFVNALQIDTQFVLAAEPMPAEIPYGLMRLNEGGYLLILAFAIIGALICLHPRNRSGGRIALVLVTVVLIAIPHIFSMFNLSTILPGRWYIFLYVPLSILAMTSLLDISRIIKGGAGKLSLIMLVVLGIIFMMSTNSVANDDSPLIYNGAKRIGYTQSELTAIGTLSAMGSGSPITDLYYRLTFPHVIGNDRYIEMVDRDNKVFIQRNYYLHHPEWNGRYRAQIHEGGSLSNYKLEEMLISDYIREQRIDKEPLIYTNGNVKVYAIPETE